jgi:hypothetical protein
MTLTVVVINYIAPLGLQTLRGYIRIRVKILLGEIGEGKKLPCDAVIKLGCFNAIRKSRHILYILIYIICIEP